MRSLTLRMEEGIVLTVRDDHTWTVAIGDAAMDGSVEWSGPLTEMLQWLQRTLAAAAAGDRAVAWMFHPILSALAVVDPAVFGVVTP